MNLADFVALWQARPFRAFRLRTADTVLTVDYPLAAALLADQSAVAIVAGEAVRQVPLAGITGAEAYGPALDLPEAIAAVGPDRVGRDATLLAAVQRASEPPAPPAPAADPGRVAYTSSRAAGGRHEVHATVFDRKGAVLFETAGTSWRAHGHDTFENGTALYLHHLAHPTVEQRILIWPPEQGSFESFAEATGLPRLRQDLETRDRRLARRPASPEQPKPAWFRATRVSYPEIPDNDRALALGREPDEFERFETRLTRTVLADGTRVVQPSLIDLAAEAILFHVVGTEWTGGVERRDESFVFRLQDTGQSGADLSFTVDPRRLTAVLHEGGRAWPLGFFQRALHNFTLHRQESLLRAELVAGPAAPRQPDHSWSIASGYRIELWGGDTRHPLPFLQPLILDPDGNPSLDLRATAWGARAEPDPVRPRVRLRLVSHEMTDRLADARLTLEIDLRAQVVTCAGFQGATCLGMLQAALRHIRGVRWLQEELPSWLAKGRELPPPVDDAPP